MVISCTVVALRMCDTTDPSTGADPGFSIGGGAPLRNDVTIQDFS